MENGMHSIVIYSLSLSLSLSLYIYIYIRSQVSRGIKLVASLLFCNLTWQAQGDLSIRSRLCALPRARQTCFIYMVIQSYYDILHFHQTLRQPTSHKFLAAIEIYGGGKVGDGKTKTTSTQLVSAHPQYFPLHLRLINFRLL